MSMKLLITVLVIEVMMNKYPVVEKFVSINGEGSRSGQLAVFIRFKGCNLNCSYCDSQYANSQDAVFTTLSDEEIINYLNETKVKNVTLTGGEPLLQPNINALISKLIALNYSVEIETNGSVDIQPFINETRPLFTLDYKLPSSNMEATMKLSNFDYLEKDDVVKFVVGNKEDLNRAKAIIDQYQLITKAKVYFSPIFNQIDPQEIVAYMIENNLNDITLQLQMHKYIWDPNLRGV